MTNDDGLALIAALHAPRSPAPTVPVTWVVLAHPDDETVGAGSRLPRLRAAQFIYVTDGAPRDGRDAARHGLAPAGYARLRRHELELALALCGIPCQQVLYLACPDQEAACRLAGITRRLLQLFGEGRPQVVLTHPYEGGHPDHDATAFAVHAAAAWLRRRRAAAPDLVEMTSYHLGPQGLRPCSFLPHTGGSGATVELTAAEQLHKGALLACFASQRETLQYFPVAVERFRPAPAYDFTQPPHAGALFYEQHAWGTTGAQFRRRAARAMAELELEGKL